jgi:hypothetical protein
VKAKKITGFAELSESVCRDDRSSHGHPSREGEGERRDQEIVLPGQRWIFSQHWMPSETRRWVQSLKGCMRGYDNTPHGKLLLTIFGGIGEFERTLILSRTHEGSCQGQSQWR